MRVQLTGKGARCSVPFQSKVNVTAGEYYFRYLSTYIAKSENHENARTNWDMGETESDT